MVKRPTMESPKKYLLEKGVFDVVGQKTNKGKFVILLVKRPTKERVCDVVGQKTNNGEFVMLLVKKPTMEN